MIDLLEVLLLEIDLVGEAELETTTIGEAVGDLEMVRVLEGELEAEEPTDLVLVVLGVFEKVEVNVAVLVEDGV